MLAKHFSSIVGTQAIPIRRLADKHYRGAVALCATGIHLHWYIHLLISMLARVKQCLTLWSTSTIMSLSFDAKLPPTTNKVNPNDKKEALSSSSFDKVTWYESTNYYLGVCNNVKPEGWVCIHQEAIAVAKINLHCGTLPTASHLTNGHNPPTLVEDDDTKKDKAKEAKPMLGEEEEDGNNNAEVKTQNLGISQGNKSSSNSSSESSSSTSSNSLSSGSDLGNIAGN